jgi:hypothetical protein
MFVRFVVKTLDPRSGRKQGLFSATAALRDSGRLGDDDDHRLELLWSWFNKNLERPKRLSRIRCELPTVLDEITAPRAFVQGLA